LEQGNTQTTIASFTGTLLRREKTADNKLVQLVFREGNENWLCVSTNPKAAQLPVGRTYKIQGVFKQAGKRPFIYEPKFALLQQSRKLSFTKLLVIAVVFVALCSAAGLYLVLRPSHGGQALGASTKHPSQTVTQQSSTTTAEPQTTATDTSQTPASTPAATTTTTKTPKKTPTTSTATPVTQTPTAPASTTEQTPVQDPVAPATDPLTPDSTPDTPGDSVPTP
jgi:cytoskeletal protein RodZ